jgi:hypothetical protein
LRIWSAQTPKEETVLSTWSVSAQREGQLSLTLFFSIGCEPAFAGLAGTILPLGTLSPFAAIGKFYEKEIEESVPFDSSFGAQRVTDLCLFLCADP